MDRVTSVDLPFRHLLSARKRVGFDCSQPMITKQEFADECDINVIMARYQSTGVLPVIQAREGRFVDAPEDDYHSAMIKVAEANSMFAQLPARIRDRFENDPGQLIAFLQDDRNLQEARELGIVEPERVPPAPIAVSVVGSGGGSGAVQQSPVAGLDAKV